MHGMDEFVAYAVPSQNPLFLHLHFSINLETFKYLHGLLALKGVIFGGVAAMEADLSGTLWYKCKIVTLSSL